MHTIATYHCHISADQPVNGEETQKYINSKSLEFGHTADRDYYSKDSFDCIYYDLQNNPVVISYRLTKDRKNRVEFIVTNTFKKEQNDIKQKLLSINND